jgi:hypothetical protein
MTPWSNRFTQCPILTTSIPKWVASILLIGDYGNPAIGIQILPPLADVSFVNANGN